MDKDDISDDEADLKKDAEPIFDEAKLDITVLEDVDDDDEKYVVYMRKRKGTYVVREMANLRADAKISELACDDE